MGTQAEFGRIWQIVSGGRLGRSQEFLERVAGECKEHGGGMKR